METLLGPRQPDCPLRTRWPKKFPSPSLAIDRKSTSSAGSRRDDFDRDLHGEMVGRGPNPCALQGDRLTRLAYDRDAHKVLIPDHAARRIKVDPARARNIDLDPGMG